MIFKELRDLFIGDYTFVEVYDDADETEHILTAYNGRDNLVDDYNDCRVTGITVCGHYGCSSAVRVEIAHEDVQRAKKLERANKINRFVFGENYNPDRYSGGICRFEMTSGSVEELIGLGLMSSDSSHNDSPTIGQMLSFVHETSCPEGWSFEGFCVAPDRNDRTLIVIDALYTSMEDLTKEDLCEFAETFRYADEFDLRPYCARAWWD